jgi:hypothetical protein
MRTREIVCKCFILNTQVEGLEKEVAALAGTEVVLAKLHSRRQELAAKVNASST